MVTHPHPFPAESYDYAVIGSGISGLICAAYLAKKGRSVAVLEQNHQIGGCLQVFSRDRKIFDTGVHYIGGLGDGQSLKRLFDFIGIGESLKYHRLDPNHFDRIVLKESGRIVDLAQGWDRFAGSLGEQFPEQKGAITAFCEKMKDTVARFSPYHLNPLKPGRLTTVDLSEGAWQVITSFFSDAELIAALGGSSILYAGNRSKTPFYVYALILNSYIEGAFRMIHGGSQIAKHLSRIIHDHDGVIHKYSKVEAIEIKDEKAVRLRCEKERYIEAAQFISCIHPSELVRLLPGESLRSTYRERVSRLPNMPALISVYFTIRENTLPYFNYNYYVIKNYRDAWEINAAFDGEWPRNLMVSTGCEEEDQQWCNTVNVLAYCDYQQFSEWEDSFNTTAVPGWRGDRYEQLKNKFIEKIKSELEDLFPGFPDMVVASYCSTPLTYRDFLSAPQGTPYGVEKDFNDPLFTFVSPKLKIPNIFLTGQSTDLHGVYGASVSALLTLSHIDDGKLVFDEIQQYIKHSRP